METKHTPGPWKAEKDSPNKYSTWSVYSMDGKTFNGFICQTSGNCEPNAKLIAAAPELLEALQSVFSHSKDNLLQLPEYLFIEIQNVINKATE